MATPVRTALTTGSNKTSNTTINSASITLSAGDMLVVLFAGDTQATSVTWNSLNLTQGPGYDYSGNVATSIWYLKVTSGASAVVTMNYSSATAKAWSILKVTNVTRGFVYYGSLGTGDYLGYGSAAPAAAWNASTLYTVRPDSYFVGILGTEGPSGDTAATWAEPSGTGQRSGTTGNPAGGNITVSEGYQVVASAQTGFSVGSSAATGFTDRDYSIAFFFFDSGNEKFAQAQAQIKTFGINKFAQAQAKIPPPPVLAQANARIKQTYPSSTPKFILDTFTEAGTGTADLSTHTPEIGATWTMTFDKSTGKSTALIDKDNDLVTWQNTTDNTISEVYYSVPTLVNDAIIIIDARSLNETNGSSPKILFRQDSSNLDTFYYVVPGLGIYSLTDGASTLVATHSASERRWVRILFSGINPTIIKVESQSTRGLLGTGWQTETSDNTAINQVSSGYVGIGGYGTLSSSESYTLDNLEVSAIDSQTWGDSFGQAQAEITTSGPVTRRSYAQSQANILTTYKVYAQAQTHIKKIFTKSAQSRACIALPQAFNFNIMAADPTVAVTLYNTNATYTTAAASASSTASTAYVGQAFSSPNYTVYEHFSIFPVNSIISKGAIITDASLSYVVVTAPPVDFIVNVGVREWLGDGALTTADWAAPATLASLTVVAYADTANMSNSSVYKFISVGTELIDAIQNAVNTSSGLEFILWSQKHEDGTAPTGSEALWLTGNPSTDNFITATWGGANNHAQAQAKIIINAVTYAQAQASIKIPFVFAQAQAKIDNPRIHIRKYYFAASDAASTSLNITIEEPAAESTLFLAFVSDLSSGTAPTITGGGKTWTAASNSYLQGDIEARIYRQTATTNASSLTTIQVSWLSSDTDYMVNIWEIANSTTSQTVASGVAGLSTTDPQYVSASIPKVGVLFNRLYLYIVGDTLGASGYTTTIPDTGADNIIEYPTANYAFGSSRAFSYLVYPPNPLADDIEAQAEVQVLISDLNTSTPYALAIIRLDEIRIRNIAQAEAYIGTSVSINNGYAQAEAAILTTYNSFTQSQADILTTYQGFSQGNAWIKITQYGYAQANSSIIVTSQVYAQAQADILATYTIYAQSQADILQSYLSCAQSQADILQTYQSFAQANASIIVTAQVYAQSQGTIKAVSSAWAQTNTTIKSKVVAHAQASVWIKQTYPNGSGAQVIVYDTFTGSGLVSSHTPDIGGSWTVDGGFTVLSIVNNAATISDAPEEDSGEFLAKQTSPYTLGDGYIQGQLVQGFSSIDYTWLIIRLKSSLVYYRINSNGTLYRVDSSIFSLGSTGGGGAWFRIQATGSDPTYLKIEQRNTETELGTGWQIETTNNSTNNQTSSSVDHGFGGVWQTYDTPYSGTIDSYKAVTSGSINGPTFAQAQAKIKTTNTQFAQSQAHIKSTYQSYAQTQASIKAVSSVFAQAEAQITGSISTIQVFAQAEASILATSVAHAQAQSDIKQEYAGYAQTSVWIKQTYPLGSSETIIFQDSFTEAGTGLADLTTHTPEIGTWAFDDLGAWKIDKTNDYATVSTYGNDSAYSTETISDGFIQGNILGSLVYLGTRTDSGYPYNTYGIYYQSSKNNIRLVRGSTGIYTEIGSAVSLSYVHAKLSIVGYSPTGLKVYVSNTSDFTDISPVIEISDNTANYQLASGLAVIIQANTGQIDDILVGTLSGTPVGSSNPFAQAQAKILQTYTKSAQAQTHIKAIYQSYAQAQVTIKQTYQVYAQAEVSIVINLQTYQAYAQVQTSLKVTDNVTFAQAQADILQTYQGYAQGQASIKQAYIVVAQAQASTKTIYMQSAQAQTSLRQVYQGFAQAQGTIKQTSQSYSNTQALIKQFYQAYAQGSAWIEITASVFAQAQTDIKTTYQIFGQAQADIKQTYVQYAQGQAQVKQTYQGYAQAQAQIVQTYQVYAQASAWIVTAQQGYGQAQGTILAASNAYAQAEAKILGQAVVTDAYAQAQGTVLQAYQVSAQAQAQVLTTYVAHAQAAAWIRDTYEAFANTQSTIKTTYNAFAQSQADIKQAYQVYANAQAQIKTTYQVFAQASADIKQTYTVSANAQATILAAYTIYAQANAYIFTTSASVAQAQASILATTNASAQALAYIYMPQISRPVADIETAGWLRVVI